MKKVYLYDGVSGLFSGDYEAQESPLEPGVFLTPTASTTVMPPQSLNKIAKWDGVSWKLVNVTPPEESPEEPAQKRFTPLEFLESFTPSEQLAVVQATLVNAQMKLWYDKMLAASYVYLTDERTIGGLTALVTFGLLTQQRKDEILNAA